MIRCTCTRHAVSPRCPKHGRTLSGFWQFVALVSLVALIYAAPDSLKGLAVAALALLFVVVTLPTQPNPSRRSGKPSREKDLSDSQ